MVFVPLWKVKREALRLVKQTNAAPGKIYDKFLSTPIHDLLKRGHVQRFDGELPRIDRVAIYLVFPSSGLLPSHKLAIEHLKACGYAPLVVSNLPLSEPDCGWLSRNTYKFLIRPNIGYDFGGYREGVLTLADEIKGLQYLAFFNDSTWFPVPGSKDWLPQAEALGVDYASAASSFGIPPVRFDDFRKIKWQLDVKIRNFHYCSYALLVRKEILQSRAFWRYWKFLPLTADKQRVVRAGEIGLTKFVLRNGFSHGSTYDMTTLPTVLAKCSNVEINRISRNLITLGNLEAIQLVEQVVPKLDAQRSQAEREDLIKVILTVVARTGVSYVVPELLIKNNFFSFLKKSPLALCKRDSDVMVALGKTLTGSAGRVIEDEMQLIRKRS